MNKLQLFRIIGESQARTMNVDIIGTDDISSCLFEEIVKEMYPKNMHRRDWALANMEMFYTQEKERIEIMRRLSTDNTGYSILKLLKARKALRES